MGSEEQTLLRFLESFRNKKDTEITQPGTFTFIRETSETQRDRLASLVSGSKFMNDLGPGLGALMVSAVANGPSEQV